MIKTCQTCEIEFKTYQKKRKYCSKICAQAVKKLDEITKNCEIIGCTNTFITKDGGSREKRFCSRDCQVIWQKVSQLGENNGNYGRENKWGSHDKEMRKLISSKIKKTWEKESRLIKYYEGVERFKDKHGYHPMHSPESKEKRSEQFVKRIEKNGHKHTYRTCKRGYHLSLKSGIDEYYHSSWEKKRMIEMDNDDNIIKWTKKHGVIVKYYHGGFKKSYIPDFLIEYCDNTVIIEEVKGYISDEEVFQLKNKSIREYCSQHNMAYVVNLMSNYEKYKHLI